MWAYDEQWVNGVMGPLLASRYKQVGRIIGDDPQYAAWPSRVLADIYQNGFTPEASLAKHDRELCAALGITIPFPQAPSRSDLLDGQTTQQGLIVHSLVYGDMPWWGGAWAWLTKEDRAHIAPQLLAHGDTIAVIQNAMDGKPLYDEGGQFYSPDKFGPLALSADAIVELVAETVQLGLNVWLFLDGDDGQNGYPVAIAQAQQLGPLFAAYPAANLNQYVVVGPGWDGVWHKPGPDGTGYTPTQIKSFSDVARASGFLYVFIEGGTGYMLCGEGGGDYLPGGNMSGYDLILLEFNDNEFLTGDVWQILARYLGPAYRRPIEQQQIIDSGPSNPLYPQANDPSPIFVLSPGTPRGPYVPRVFEYFIYGFVRNATVAEVQAAYRRFVAMGAINVC